jgi:hypothetical protein
LASYLLSSQQQLGSVDWSDFRFALGPHPAVAYYLSVQYLRGIVDDLTEITFSGHMLRYYEAYFNNAAWWFQPQLDVGRVIGFVQHTLLMAHACRALKTMLSSEEGEQAHIQAKEWIQDIARMMNWEN